MSSIKTTFGALLGTVTSTAATVTSILDAAAEGAAMGKRYAEHHSSQQRKDYAVLSLTQDDVAVERAAKHQIERLRELKALNMNAEEQAMFIATQDRVRAALANVK